jgi:hypothetical protein
MSAIAKALPQFVRGLMASCPRAGEGVNPWLYQLARVLHPYRSEAEIYAILRRATADCGRIVTEKEILRAIENSKQAAWTPGSSPSPGRPARPPWPRVNEERREAILSEGYGLVDLWEESTIRFEDNEPHTEEIIDLLFPGNPLLCTGKVIDRSPTRLREKWRGELAGRQFIVPSPMSAKAGLTQEGKVSQRSLSNTGPRRFLVVELDAGSVEDDAILQFADNHGVTDAAMHLNGAPLNLGFTAGLPPYPAGDDSVANSGADVAPDGNAVAEPTSECRSYQGWMISSEREVADDPSISLPARGLYVIICGYVGKNCEIPFPALKTLAWKAGCGRETVQGYIAELEKAKVLEVVPRRAKGRFMSNGYVLLRRSKRSDMPLEPGSP